MAEGEDTSQERSLEPTDKKLLDARKKGQIARSRELNTSVMLLSSSALFFTFGETTGMGVLTMFESALQVDRFDIFDPSAPLKEISEITFSMLKLLTPIFLLLTCCLLYTSPSPRD